MVMVYNVLAVLVDPGRLTVNFDPTCSPDDGIMDTERDRMAQGVITIRVKGSSHAKKSAHEGTWVLVQQYKGITLYVCR